MGGDLASFHSNEERRLEGIRRVLTLWQCGFLTSADVVAWSDNEIRQCEVPAQELIDLSNDGPQRCLMNAEYVFPPRPYTLDFSTLFSLHALRVDREDYSSCLAFATWAARNAMGKSLEIPEVKFSYGLDYLLDHCSEAEAAECVRDELLARLDDCKIKVSNFLEQIPNFKFASKLRL